MILQIHTSLAKMDKSLLEAANDLGATPVQAFLRVTLPLSLPGVISGITLVFLPAVSSFFIPKLLGGGQFVLVGNIIESQFLTSGDWNFGSAISLIMAIIIHAFNVAHAQGRRAARQPRKGVTDDEKKTSATSKVQFSR